MSESPAIDVLVRGARALARMDTPAPILDELLAGLAAATGATSGAFFVAGDAPGELAIAASLGLGVDAAAGLAAAVRNPAHSVARTFASGEAGFDVLPAAPGGPAKRSHVALVVARGGQDLIVGVLALAHDRPIGVDLRPVVLAAADLAAAAIDRGHRR